MHWLAQNINHLTVPLGVLLGLSASVLNLYIWRKRKAGMSHPHLSRRLTIAAYIVLCVCFILLGIALAQNFG